MPSLVSTRLTEAATAIRFLTRLPVPGAGDHRPDALAHAAWAFPIAGIVVGGLAGIALWVSAAAFHLHPIASSLIAVGVAAWVSGGLHEDGLADTADGFGGGHDRPSKLRIMRDHHIGTFGVLALIIGVGLRAAALASFVGPGYALAGVIVACGVSRSIIPIVMALLPSVQADGLSRAAGRPTALSCVISLLIAAAAVLIIAGPAALIPTLVAALLGALAVAALAKRQIGGQTGDILGAAEQVAQICALFALTGVFMP